MKTAMQELIDKTHPNFFTEFEKTYFLEKEKKQINEAYRDGYENGCEYSCENEDVDYYELKYTK